MPIRANPPKDAAGNPIGRHCAICGKMGGHPLKAAIQLLKASGYPLKGFDHENWAHPDCVAKARAKLKRTKK